MNSNQCIYMDYSGGVETIKRHTRAACSCMVAGQRPWAQALLWPLHVHSVCDKSAGAAAICGLCHYTNAKINNNNHDDIYSAVVYGASHMQSSLWFLWAKVGQRQVAANS